MDQVVFSYTIDLKNSLALTPSSVIDMAYGSLYHGIDWIYTYSESLFLYDINTYFNIFGFNIYQDSFEYNYYAAWYNTLDVSYYNLFWSILVDNFINLHLLKFHALNEFFKTVSFSGEYSLILFNMPEFIIISNSFLKFVVLPFSSQIDTLIVSMYDYENTTNPVILIPHILFFWLFAFYFFYVFFSYYSSSSKEETLIDHDFLIANVTVESEEEIAAVDDLLFGSCLLVFIFFWYFYANVYFAFLDVGEAALVVYLFPFLFYTILFVPASLAIDFGLYFVCYLRGVGKAPISLVEVMYDYIGFAAFYIRLLVQNVRLILMMFTFASFHEIVQIALWDKHWIMGDESFLDDLTTAVSSPSGFCYVLVFKLSGHLMYFLYELIHLLFVVTAQIIAFNAMVFWLFLFLYTMFSTEIHERFFKIKRSLKKQLLRKYHKLKTSIFKK
jgi:hypothetical protein